MMFWCHNCQRAVHSVQSIKCEFCSCEAIEEITPQNCPQNFQPYIPQNSAYSNQQFTQQTQQIPQANPRPRQQRRDPIGMDFFGGFSGMNMMSTIFSNVGNGDAPMFIRYSIGRPVFSILIIDTEEDNKTPVEAQKISQLQKVQCLKEECAICQQKEGSGLVLPCKHQFHETCIKPWFEQTNTCPCCRTAL